MNKIKNFKAVIFDHDNTIAHTEPLWVQAVIEFLQERDILLSENEKTVLADELLGLGLVPIVQLLKHQFKVLEHSDYIQSNICEKIQRAYSKNLSFIPGFLTFIQTVHVAGLRVAIASNSDPGSLSLAIKQLGLKKLFGTHIYTAADVSHPKPEPDLYIYAAKQLGVSPSQCIAIEDSSHGIQAAKQAGMFCIGIMTSGKRQLVDKADLIVTAYDEIDIAAISADI